MSQSQPDGNRKITVAFKFYEGRLRVGIPYRLFEDLARLSGSRTYREVEEPPADQKAVGGDSHSDEKSGKKDD